MLLETLLHLWNVALAGLTLEYLVDGVANHWLHDGAVALEVGMAGILAPLLGQTSQIGRASCRERV